LEQVAFFALTEYSVDAKSPAELDFEQTLLHYDKRGGFVLTLLQRDDDDAGPSLDMVDLWLSRMGSLGGPKLLDRGPSSVVDDQKWKVPSFQSDRRLIRLIIARYFADVLIDKYLQEIRTSSSETVDLEEGR
jgi:hypothetical protein